MARYVVTGASGHIGNNFIRLVNEIEPQADIVCLTRREVTRELAGTVCRQVVGDLNDSDFLAGQIQPDDMVVHLAGLIDLSGKKREESVEINYRLTKKITDCSLAVGVRRFLYVGSVDGIAKRPGMVKIAEPKEFYPEAIEDTCGKTKAMAMNYVADCMRRHHDFPCVMVMPSAVIGIHDYKPSAVGRVILNVLAGGAEWAIRGGYNFVDVRDVAAAIYLLCQRQDQGSYILCGHSVSVRDLYGFINKEMGKQRAILTIPRFLARLATPFVKVLSKTTLKALTDPHDYSARAAKEAFGYSPLPIETTMHDTVAWFIEHFESFTGSPYDDMSGKNV